MKKRSVKKEISDPLVCISIKKASKRKTQTEEDIFPEIKTISAARLCTYLNIHYRRKSVSYFYFFFFLFHFLYFPRSYLFSSALPFPALGLDRSIVIVFVCLFFVAVAAIIY